MKAFLLSLFFLPTLLFADKTALDRIGVAKKKARTFLINSQLPNGAWGDATKTKGLNIYAPGPKAHLAFQTACTSLCVMSLAAEHEQKGVKTALRRGTSYLLKNSPFVVRASGQWVGNIWSHAYMIQAFLKMRKVFPARQEEIDQAIKLQIKRLDSYAYLNGGWGYYNFRNINGLQIITKTPTGESASFITGTCLLALYKAQQAGFDVSKPLVSKAITNLSKQLNPDTTFLYSEDYKLYPKARISKEGGSAARTPNGLLALYRWKNQKVKKGTLDKGMNLFVRFERWLDLGRKKPVPHESYFGVAGYFYYFGHYYASECLLESDFKQKERAKILANIIVSKQETNGSWFDYPLYNYGHFYGTGYALLCLQNHETVLRK